jgi:glutamate 5-kinase
MNEYREKLTNANRIIIKVGTSTLTHSEGRINLRFMDEIACVISDLLDTGKEVVLVSSGAIGVGASKLGLSGHPKDLPGRQASAAVGQCELMNMYNSFFSKYGRKVGQMLLTKEILFNEEIKRNTINTFEALFLNGVVPIVNENDTISVEELVDLDSEKSSSRKNGISFGDNDTLSAIVSAICNADLLIILTDTDGFYDDNPSKNPDANLISIVKNLDDEIRECAYDSDSEHGTGGFVTKLEAAKIATEAGIDLVIARGDNPAVVRQILAGEDKGTLFVAE